MNERAQISQLCFALGLAIGAIEMVNVNPHGFDKEGLDKVLERIKMIAELPFVVNLSESQAEDRSEDETV